MEAIRIKQIQESDFDGIVERAGGKRFLDEGSADYELNEALIELKLVEEEGFEKDTRRQKLANLFQRTQPNSPVVVIDPSILNGESEREYYRIVEGPMKTQIKKGDKQLERTANRLKPEATRVLIVANIGYTALSADEFKAVCVKCAHNDTTKIDSLVCAGIYYHSDGFDSWILTRFEHIPINVSRPFRSWERLLGEWSKFLDEAMAEHIRKGEPLDVGKLPALDLIFEQSGTRFIKPTPKLPTSDFWPQGRAPRENSRGEELPEPMAKSFPTFTEVDWAKFKKALPSAPSLQVSYRAWLQFEEQQNKMLNQERKPFVPIRVNFEAFSRVVRKRESDWNFRDVCIFANDLLNANIREVLKSCKDGASIAVVPIEYLHVTVEEIGQDRGDDLCLIRHISNVPGFERNEPVLEKFRGYWEEGVCLAACYAVKKGISQVIYHKVQR